MQVDELLVFKKILFFSLMQVLSISPGKSLECKLSAALESEDLEGQESVVRALFQEAQELASKQCSRALSQLRIDIHRG